MEKDIERRLRRGIEGKGGLCLKLHTLSVKGLPDRVILMPGGRCSFVETKQAGKKPTAIQVWWHKFLRELGFNVDVIDTIEQVDSYVSSI